MWLVGMMGSGKSTVGERAASRLLVPFYDTDRVVVEMAERPIAEIWEEHGEEAFRDLERRAVASVPGSGFIAAAGGGAVLDPSNQDLMSRGRPVVWLRASPDALAARLAGDGSRPLLSGEGTPEARLASLLETRKEVYTGIATDFIDTDGVDVDEIVTAVVELWQR